MAIHPVIADTNRAYLLESSSVPNSLLVCQTAVKLLANVLDGLEDDRPTDWPIFRVLTPHLQALLNLQKLLVNSATSLNEETLDILVRVTGHTAMAFGQMRSPEFGLELVTSALTYVSQRADDPISGIVIARQQLAHLLDQMGRPAMAETIYRNLLEAQRRLWPYDDPAILATRSNIAGTVGSQQGPSDRYYSPGLLHAGLLSAGWDLGDVGGGEPGVVMVPSGAGLVASPPSGPGAAQVAGGAAHGRGGEEGEAAGLGDADLDHAGVVAGGLIAGAGW